MAASDQENNCDYLKKIGMHLSCNLLSIQSFAYIWLHNKGNQNEFSKHPKIKWLDPCLWLVPRLTI